MFSYSYIARLNFLHTDHTALAYRSIESPFTKPSSYASEDAIAISLACMNLASASCIIATKTEAVSPTSCNSIAWLKLEIQLAILI